MYEIFHTSTQENFMKICKIKDCEDKVHARKWCHKHYMRWYMYGDPNIVKKEHHGYRNHPLCGVWDSMKQRCYNKDTKYYKDYGGRGITICSEWKNSAKAFIEWALPLWKKGLEIDRRDNDGNYKPSNCRFITRIENVHNQRLLYKHNTSGYRGVSYHKGHEKWAAYMRINNKLKHLGYFNSAKEAALAFNGAVTDNRPKNIII